MNASEIKDLINSEMENASVEVKGESGKYLVSVVSETFDGLNAVKRQQAVYRILNPHISSGDIHAVNMELSTPSEAEA